MNLPSFSRCIDTIHTNVPNVPNSVPYVGGYVTGSGDVPWTAEDWQRFRFSTHLRIVQDPGASIALTDFDIIDVESGAFTPQEAADRIEARVKVGIVWTDIYADDPNAQETAALVQAKGPEIWIGHVGLWYANWNLDEAKAAALLGTEVHGMTTDLVQWASPTSNPDTQIYFGGQTLKQANCDLSVVRYGFTPHSFPPVPVPVQPPPGIPPMHGVLVSLPTGETMAVSSTDNGITWRK
jgi:hypothetical protein